MAVVFPSSMFEALGIPRPFLGQHKLPTSRCFCETCWSPIDKTRHRKILKSSDVHGVKRGKDTNYLMCCCFVFVFSVNSKKIQTINWDPNVGIGLVAAGKGTCSIFVPQSCHPPFTSSRIDWTFLGKSSRCTKQSICVPRGQLLFCGTELYLIHLFLSRKDQQGPEVLETFVLLTSRWF